MPCDELEPTHGAGVSAQRAADSQRDETRATAPSTERRQWRMGERGPAISRDAVLDVPSELLLPLSVADALRELPAFGTD
ncbi:hypothetical protein SRHO_G00223060 [Serrasalmus rhombeus]